MCRFEDSSRAKDCGVTEADKKVILETHNRLRSKVSPSSSNMMKMVSAAGFFFSFFLILRQLHLHE